MNAQRYNIAINFLMHLWRLLFEPFVKKLNQTSPVDACILAAAEGLASDKGEP